MRQLLTLALIPAFLLTGCELKGVAGAGKKDKQQAITAYKDSHLRTAVVLPLDANASERAAVFQPKAVISTSSITYQTTKATIFLTDRKVTASKINYHIWRTADGSRSMKTFSSTDPNNNFSILLDINNFSSQRGEYQVEAYNIEGNGIENLIAKLDVTFDQYVPILMYHAIDDYRGKGWKGLFVSPANFEAQMRYLKDHGYTLLTFERFGDINKVNKPIFVTFDDGMKNNLNALQIFVKLQDENFKPTATAFIIANRIDSGLFSLSSEDLRAMANSGIFSIQAHTLTHSDLRTITNYEQELGTSEEKIEQITGRQVIAVAYPSGRFNDKVVEEVKKYYQYAVTTRPGQFIEKGITNELLLMRRLRITDTTTLEQFAASVQ